MLAYQSGGSHPVGSLIPDPFEAGPIRRPTIDELADATVLQRCYECWKEHDGEWEFCSDACEEQFCRRMILRTAVFEERWLKDTRPVGESLTCTCGLCLTIRSQP
jgi:hypothetical protein